MVANSERRRFEARITRGKHTYIVRTTRANMMRVIAWLARWVFDKRFNFRAADGAEIARQLKEQL